MFIKYKIKYVKNMINIMSTLLYTKIKHSSLKSYRQNIPTQNRIIVL